MSTLHLNNYLRPNAGATLSNTPLMYLWLSSAPNTFATSIASLIATLYGSLLANVVCLPMASKLKARHDEEFLCKQLVMEGVLAIQEGENPKFIEEKLYKLLPASYKKPADKGEKQDGNNDGKKNSKKKGIGKRRRWNKKEIEE